MTSTGSRWRAWLVLTATVAIVIGAAIHLAPVGPVVEELHATVPADEVEGLLILRWVVFLAAAVALLLAAWRFRPMLASTDRLAASGELSSGFAARVWLYLLLPAFLAGSLAQAMFFGGDDHYALKWVFLSVFLLGGAAWLAALAARPDRLLRSPRGGLRILEILAANVLLLLVLAEGTIHIYGRLNPSQLLWNEGSVTSAIEARRYPADTPFFGRPTNHSGYNDDEFFQAVDDDYVVGLLADSFGLGVVPYSYNFATVAERRLQEELADSGGRVAIHNFGIGAIGMAEYAWLLQHEVLGWNPSTVVLSVFVGNDIAGFETVKRRYYSFQNLKLHQWLVRILRVQKAGQEAGRFTQVAPTEKQEGSIPEFILDPTKEPPSYDPETFLGIERVRVEICNPDLNRIERRWEAFFEALATIHEMLGDRLRILVIPDEFQVDDALWRTLMERVDKADQFQRELPQNRILSFAEDHGIPVLDLLPALRAGHERERVYHLRDTHWNAAGNRIAGEALAQFLLETP